MAELTIAQSALQAQKEIGSMRAGEDSVEPTHIPTASENELSDVTVTPHSPLHIIRPKSGLTTEGDRYRILCDESSTPAIDVIVAQGMPEERFDAYVRLFAAAPDLLAALKALVDRTERMDNPSDMGVGADEDVMVAARVAIDRAEGR
jgi:hypothetical protein